MKWFTCEEKNVNDDSTKLAIERERERLGLFEFFYLGEVRGTVSIN